MKIDELITMLEKIKAGFGDAEVMVQGTGVDYQTVFAVKSMTLKAITETPRTGKKKKSITYQAIVFVPDDVIPTLDSKMSNELWDEK
jgi:hypothetical protein